MQIKIFGHRGCRGKENPPENSLAAFKAAIDQGADGVEMDIFLTGDKHLVVFHDDTLERMTEGKGNITSFSLAELNKLHLKDIEGKLTESKIPTLNEVFSLVGNYRKESSSRAKNFLLNIEIKGLGISNYVAKAIKEKVAGGWSLDNFLVSSFDTASLYELRKHSPEIPIGALYESGEKPWDISEQQLASALEKNKDLKPRTVNITLPSLTPKAIKMIKDIGAEPVAWTCDEISPDKLTGEKQERLRKQLQSGISAIITDYPGQIRKLLGI